MEYDCFRRYTLQELLRWMANRLEMDGTQDPWLSGQIGLLSLGKLIYVLFSGIGVRYGCHNVLTFGFFLTFGSFVLSWQEQAQWDHVFDGEMKAQ